MLEAAESAVATAVGVLAAPTRLDDSGYRATFQIERLVAGSLGGAEIVAVGWEQFGDRPARFREGERLLLALDRVPGQTLWVKRFPGRSGYVIGARFGAFLRDPDPGTVALLHDYLTLDPDTRKGTGGVAALSQMVASAEPAVALGSVERLGLVPGLSGRLLAAGDAALAGALADDGRPLEVRRAVLELAAERRLSPLRPSVAALAVAGNPLEAPALETLAILDGGLAPERVAALVVREEAPVRRVAVVYGGESVSDGQLEWLLRNDPAPEVRRAALSELLERRGLDALGDATPALFDPDGSVRGESALRIAALGPSVVPVLQSLVTGRSAEDLTAVFVALRMAGTDGVAVLQNEARNHPDPQVRALALTALGRPPGK